MSTNKKPEEARKSSFINIAFDSGVVWENQRAQRLIKRNLDFYSGTMEELGLQVALRLLQENVDRPLPEEDNKA